MPYNFFLLSFTHLKKQPPLPFLCTGLIMGKTFTISPGQKCSGLWNLFWRELYYLGLCMEFSNQRILLCFFVFWFVFVFVVRSSCSLQCLSLILLLQKQVSNTTLLGYWWPPGIGFIPAFHQCSKRATSLPGTLQNARTSDAQLIITEEATVGYLLLMAPSQTQSQSASLQSLWYYNKLLPLSLAFSRPWHPNYACPVRAPSHMRKKPVPQVFLQKSQNVGQTFQVFSSSAPSSERGTRNPAELCQLRGVSIMVT